MMRTFKPFLIALGAGAVVFAALYLLLVYPTLRERTKEQALSTELDKRLTDYSASVVMIDAFVNARDSLRDLNLQLNERLYARADVMALIGQLSQLCDHSHVTLRELSPSVNQLLAMNAVRQSDTDPQYLELSLRVTGSIRAVSEWMHQLSDEPFFIQTNSIHAYSREQGFIPAEYVINFTAALGALPVEQVATK